MTASVSQGQWSAQNNSAKCRSQAFNTIQIKAQLMAEHGESAWGILMGCSVWPCPVGLPHRRPYAHRLRRFRLFHRLRQCGRSITRSWQRAMAGCNNPMLSEGAPPMGPWRGASSGCSHNLTVRRIKLA